MTATLPPALHKAVDLFAEQPQNPDVSKGYLDLIGSSAGGAPVAKNTGAIQSMWASSLGSLFYDNAQALARRMSSVWRLPLEWLDIPLGGVVLDVGCGPGSMTSPLARATGPDGLVLGLDVSEPMLARAVRAHSEPQVGFMRADAQQLPLRDGTVDVVVSIAAMQLVPNPVAAIAEIARVLRPGGRVAVMVPTVGHPGPVFRLLPNPGAYFFGDDELADILEDNGFVGVRSAKHSSGVQWVRGRREGPA